MRDALNQMSQDEGREVDLVLATTDRWLDGGAGAEIDVTKVGKRLSRKRNAHAYRLLTLTFPLSSSTPYFP